ncbi:hypothetical protein [Micromonospora sp. DT47]|uniref:hypothetical protein n=1 Tax=Micromonospora sp. DT47 TaxID=3393431 RepID=UPI003CED8973
MTDFTAHDIHLLDQAAVDAFDDVDHLTDDPETKRRLDERGPAVYAAELTRDLIAACNGRVGVAAGFAAMATIRRVQERDDRNELAAELAEVRDQLTAANRHADGLKADLNSATKANTAWANQISQIRGENTRLRAKLADLGEPADADHWVNFDGTCWADCPACKFERDAAAVAQ